MGNLQMLGKVSDDGFGSGRVVGFGGQELMLRRRRQGLQEVSRCGPVPGGSGQSAEGFAEPWRVALIVPRLAVADGLNPCGYRAGDDLSGGCALQAQAEQLLESRCDFVSQPVHFSALREVGVLARSCREAFAGGR